MKIMESWHTGFGDNNPVICRTTCNEKRWVATKYFNWISLLLIHLIGFRIFCHHCCCLLPQVSPDSHSLKGWWMKALPGMLDGDRELLLSGCSPLNSTGSSDTQFGVTHLINCIIFIEIIPCTISGSGFKPHPFQAKCRNDLAAQRSFEESFQCSSSRRLSFKGDLERKIKIEFIFFWWIRSVDVFKKRKSLLYVYIRNVGLRPGRKANPVSYLYWCWKCCVYGRGRKCGDTLHCLCAE